MLETGRGREKSTVYEVETLKIDGQTAALSPRTMPFSSEHGSKDCQGRTVEAADAMPKHGGKIMGTASAHRDDLIC